MRYTMPTRKEMRAPLLVLLAINPDLSPKQAAARIAVMYDLSPVVLEATDKSDGQSSFEKEVRFTRQVLRREGVLESTPEHRWFLKRKIKLVAAPYSCRPIKTCVG